MKYISLISFLLMLNILNGCNNIPPIHFKVEKINSIKVVSDKGRIPKFELTLSSATNIIDYFKKEKGANMYLFGSLMGNGFTKTAISNDSFQIHGGFPTDTVDVFGNGYQYKKNNTYYYIFQIEFATKAYDILESEDALRLMHNKQIINCIIVMAFQPFRFKSYHSEIFSIPIDSFKKHLQK